MVTEVNEQTIEKILKLKIKRSKIDDEIKELESLIVGVTLNQIHEYSQSRTFDFGRFKVTTRKSEKWVLDQEKYEPVGQHIPAEMQPIKVKIELDKNKYDALETMQPMIYKAVQKCVTLKIGKPSVTIK